MKMFIQIIIDPENGQPATTKNVAEFKRESLSTDTLGLTLLESKVILKNIQSVAAQQQVDHYIHEHQPCPRCHQHQTIKGHHIIVYRTLFGKLSLKSPGLTICSCQNSDQKSISPLSKVLPERMSPEFQFLQSKWASLVSYGMALNIIEDVLPVKSNTAIPVLGMNVPF